MKKTLFEKMRFVLLVLMTMAAVIGCFLADVNEAHAQPAAPPKDHVAPAECIPLINGYPIGEPEVFQNSEAWHLFWFCGDSKHTKVTLNGFSCAKGYCRQSIFSEVVFRITRASAKVGTYKTEWAKWVTVDCDKHLANADPMSVMCKQRMAIIEANKARWIAQTKWWVEDGQ